MSIKSSCYGKILKILYEHDTLLLFDDQIYVSIFIYFFTVTIIKL